MQLPQDCLGTTTWPPFHCFGTPIWPPWRHVKTLYKYRLQAKSINVPRILIYHVEGMVFFTKTMRTCWQVYSKVSFSTLIYQFFFFKKGKWLPFFIVKNIAVASMATTLTTMTFYSVEVRFSYEIITGESFLVISPLVWCSLPSLSLTFWFNRWENTLKDTKGIVTSLG